MWRRACTPSGARCTCVSGASDEWKTWRSARWRCIAARPLWRLRCVSLARPLADNLQCAHDAHLFGPLDLISIENDVAIQTGAYIQATRWSGEGLHIGPIRIESGCKIGMRAAVANDVTIGRGTWITPFTPILSDVGSQEIWEGAPARLSGRCTELKRTADFCRYAHPIWLLETLKVVMHIFLFFCLNMLPIAVIAWAARAYTPAGDAELSSDYFSVTPLPEIVWDLTLYAFIAAWASIVLTSLLGCLFIRCTAASPGLYPSRGLKGALLAHRMDAMNAIQRQWTWTITGQYLRALAGMRFARLGASECDLMINLVPELATAGSQVFWSNSSLTNMLDYGARTLHAAPTRHAREFLLRQQLRGRVRAVSGKLSFGCLHAEQRHTVPAANAVAA